MSEFKTGDTVLYTGNNPEYHQRSLVGKVGVVQSDTTNDSTRVKFEGRSTHGVYNENLELFGDKTNTDTILDTAKSLVYGDRNADYGHPYEDYLKNAAFLQVILGDKLKEDAVITPQEVILFMITLKVSRLVNDHTKVDSIVDVAGYAECLSRVNRREAGLE